MSEELQSQLLTVAREIQSGGWKSRKLWVAILGLLSAGVIPAAMQILSGDATIDWPQTLAGLAGLAVTVLPYILAQGHVDAKRLAVAGKLLEQVTSASPPALPPPPPDLPN